MATKKLQNQINVTTPKGVTLAAAVKAVIAACVAFLSTVQPHRKGNGRSFRVTTGGVGGTVCLIGPYNAGMRPSITNDELKRRLGKVGLRGDQIADDKGGNMLLWTKGVNRAGQKANAKTKTLTAKADGPTKPARKPRTRKPNTLRAGVPAGEPFGRDTAVGTPAATAPDSGPPTDAVGMMAETDSSN